MRNHAPGFAITALLMGLGPACGDGARGPAPVDEPSREESGSGEARFAGSARCLQCHPEQATWQASNHAHAWSAAGSVPAAAPDGRVAIEGEEHTVVGWVGWDPLRQPLVERDGRIQVGPRAWDPARGEWFEVFVDGRAAGDRGHWTGPAMAWATQCAPCHTTGLEPGYRPSTHRYQTTAAEHGVGCEACHGPSAAHAEGEGSPARADPGLDACAGCHSRRAELAPGSPASVYLDRFAPQLVDASDAFWPDGQVRDEDFEHNAFVTSRMHQAGVRCVDCHDPHSGELAREGDALCLHCHEAREGWTAHDGHGGAVSCVDCHMPVTTYMQRHPRRDHGFPIPDPALAAEVGAPDPCTRACHDGSDLAWAAAALQSWGVDPDARPHRRRARAVAAAREGGPEGWTGALALLRDDPHPAWRAIGAGLLGPWAGRADVAGALDAAAGDPDPLVRFAAVGSLPPGSPRAVAASRDPVRAVRVQAQRRLLADRGPGHPDMADVALWLDLGRDQPETAVEWANWRLVHGDPTGLVELRRAWELWPADPSVAHAFAIGLASSGQGAAALPVLEDAVRRRPDEAVLQDALGRSRAAAGDIPGAIAALEEAVRLDPGAARSWYNLGVMRERSGAAEPALRAYERASAADLGDADPPWARARLLLERGETEEAREWIDRALKRDPHHPGATELEARLGR